jgi:hypothetical protein
MIKALPNNRVLVRKVKAKENTIMKVKELIEYLETKLEDQIKAQKEEDMRTRSIKSEASGASQKPSK